MHHHQRLRKSLFRTSNTNHLFIGSLWISQGSGTVLNRDYVADPDLEWVVEVEPDGHVKRNYEGPSDEVIFVGVKDEDPDPFDLYIRQESWAFDSDSDNDERKPDKTDRRRMLLRLTPKGEEVVEEISEIAAKTNRGVLSPLSPSEQRLFLDLLRRLT